MADHPAIEGFEDFPLPPLDFVSKPTNRSTTGILDDALRSPSSLHNLSEHNANMRKKISQLKYGDIEKDDPFFQSSSPSSGPDHQDLQDLSRRPNLSPEYKHRQPAFEASRRLNLFLEQQSTTETIPADLDFLDRYPALDRTGQQQLVRGRDSKAPSDYAPIIEYQRRPPPPARKGTFAAPLPPNQRLAGQGRKLPDAETQTLISNSTSHLLKDLVPISSPEARGYTKSVASSRKSVSYAQSNQSESRRSSRYSTKPSRKSSYGQFHITPSSARTQNANLIPGHSLYNLHRHAPSSVSQARSDNSFPTMHSPELLSSPPPLSPDFIDEEFSPIALDDRTYDVSMQEHNPNDFSSHSFEPRADSPILPSPRCEKPRRKTLVKSPKSARTGDIKGNPNYLQPSLLEQGTMAKTRRRSNARADITPQAIRSEQQSPQSHSRGSDLATNKIEARHAEIPVVSPKPERAPSLRSSEEGLQRLMSFDFEKYLEEQMNVKKFDLTLDDQSKLPMSSMSRGHAVASNPKDEFRTIPSLYENRTAEPSTRANASWPLPPYPVDQDSSPKLSKIIQSRRSTERVRILNHSGLPNISILEQKVTPAPVKLDHGLPSGGNSPFRRSLYVQHISEEVPVADVSEPSRNTRKSRSKSFTRNPWIHADDMKKLPKLPDNLDTSAIANPPLSTEVPLPEFATIKPPASAHLRQVTASSTPHQMYPQSAGDLVPDFAPIRPMPLLMRTPSIMTADERESSVTMPYKKSTEQSITDAFVLHLEGCEDDRRRRASRRMRPLHTRRRTIIKEEKAEADSQAPVVKKPSRGCCSGWGWFQQKFQGGAAISRLPSGHTSFLSS